MVSWRERSKTTKDNMRRDGVLAALKRSQTDMNTTKGSTPGLDLFGHVVPIPPSHRKPSPPSGQPKPSEQTKRSKAPKSSTTRCQKKAAKGLSPDVDSNEENQGDEVEAFSQAIAASRPKRACANSVDFLTEAGSDDSAGSEYEPPSPIKISGKKRKRAEKNDATCEDQLLERSIKKARTLLQGTKSDLHPKKKQRAAIHHGTNVKRPSEPQQQPGCSIVGRNGNSFSSYMPDGNGVCYHHPMYGMTGDVHAIDNFMLNDSNFGNMPNIDSYAHHARGDPHPGYGQQAYYSMLLNDQGALYQANNSPSAGYAVAEDNILGDSADHPSSSFDSNQQRHEGLYQNLDGLYDTDFATGVHPSQSIMLAAEEPLVNGDSCLTFSLVELKPRAEYGSPSRSYPDSTVLINHSPKGSVDHATETAVLQIEWPSAQLRYPNGTLPAQDSTGDGQDHHASDAASPNFTFDMAEGMLDPALLKDPDFDSLFT